MTGVCKFTSSVKRQAKDDFRTDVESIVAQITMDGFSYLFLNPLDLSSSILHNDTKIFVFVFFIFLFIRK